jgi:predicted secreted hydrolase
MRGPTISDVTLHAQGHRLRLHARPRRPTPPSCRRGIEGYSVKSEAGQASHYYSQPFYEVTGTLTLPEGDIPVTGIAWLDREWSSQPLTETRPAGTGSRSPSTPARSSWATACATPRRPTYAIATWIAPDGTPTPYPRRRLRGRAADHPRRRPEVPTRWRVTLPDRGLDVTVEALNPQAWMDTAFPYWEGPVTVTGSHTGRGYLEMTGHE